MFRFTVKAGLAGASVYYLNKEGIWKESDQSLKAYDKLNTVLQPYIEEVKNQIPFEAPHIPNRDRTSHIVKQYWNKGVTASFEFLGELPHLLNVWTREGAHTVSVEFRKLLDTIETGEKEPEEN